MSSPLLEVKDLQVTVGEEQKVLLDGLNLTVNPGETHVLMGHNGAGKSTLMSALMGDPRYTVTRGSIVFRGQDVTHESADVRARLGMFLSFQTPEEIPGITLENFLRTAQGAITGKPVKVFAFRKELAQQMEALGMDPSYAERYLNVGFSGGEKKKSEILQLLMLKPKLALLDDTDSGLDVDAVKTVAQGVRAYHNEENALIIITHNAKILEGLKVDFVHVLDDARIVRTGDDAIVVKSTGPMSRRYGASENVAITGCILHSRDSALKIGTETHGVIRNVTLSDCVIDDCSRAVGVWVRDGGTVEDIHVHHLTGCTRRYADSYQLPGAPGWWGKGEPVFVSATPRKGKTGPAGVIRRVSFDHLYLTSESCAFAAGEPDSEIQDLRISEMHLTSSPRLGTSPRTPSRRCTPAAWTV